MTSLDGKFVIVAGGTGNVGSYIVESLLKAGARVAVPSRSQQKIDALIAHIENKGSPAGGLLAFIGDAGTESGAAQLRNDIERAAGYPHAVIASLGAYRSVDSLATASPEQLNRVLNDYLVAHFVVAKTFLPALEENSGTYVFVNGPLAFEIRPGSALVSVATAAQHMLFRAFAREYEQSSVNVIELMNYAFIRNRETQPGSTVPGEATGNAVLNLLAGAASSRRGTSFHVDSANQGGQSER
jgi:NAD(P)-dependent dehydrogenase (short-subunit alcohol dehydrogenase family)